MQFETTINLGQLLTAVGFIVAGMSAWYSLRNHVEVLNYKLQGLSDKTNTITDELKLQTQILIRLERQEMEISVLRHQLNSIQDKHRESRT
jgi:hypothetical protein